VTLALRPKQLLVFIEKWGMTVLASVAAIAFLIAVRDAYLQNGTGKAGLLSLYKAFMETINSDPDTADGWEGSMHVFFKLAVGWAAVKVYMSTAGVKWDTFFARWLARSHVVIIGGPSSGDAKVSTSTNELAGAQVQSNFAVDLALAVAKSKPVVLSLPDVDEAQRAKLWESGVTLIPTEMGASDLLEATGIKRASMLIAMRDSALDNIVLTSTALSLEASGVSLFRDRSGLQCRSLLEPLSFKHRFRLEDYFEADALPRIRVFNQSELIARRMISLYPPDAKVATTNLRVHVVIVGLGSVGQALLLQLARLGHYRSGIEPKVTLVDRDALDQLAKLKLDYPALTDFVEVQTDDKRIDSIAASDVSNWAAGDKQITMIYVCTKDEVLNLRTSRLILKGLNELEKSSGPQLARVIALDPPGGSLLPEFHEHAHELHHGRFDVFSLLEQQDGDEHATIAPGLLDDLDDARAMTLHDRYHQGELKKFQEKGTPLKEAARAWEKLEETYRNANRAAADHFEVKLRAVGRALAASGSGEPAPLTESEIEILARMEHNRWWADRALDGWIYGSPRDDPKKVHPDMVEYEKLDDGTKNYDRVSVKTMVDILKAEGFDIVMASDATTDSTLPERN
jgi:RyR domain